MKILYILHSTVNGGATISFKSLVEGILQQGVKPAIIYPINQYNDTVKYFESIGCVCYPSFIAITAITPKEFFLKKIWHLSKIMLLKVLSFINIFILVRKIKPDIIHTNTGVVHEGYLIAKIMKTPHVWHIREYQEHDCGWDILPSKKIFEKELSESFGIFITKDLQAFFNQDDNTSRVVYNPIYDLEETNHIKKCDERYFLIANRISKEKGIEDIIKGYAIFCQDIHDYKLKIAGFGDEKYIHDLKRLCIELNIADQVDFIGYVSDMRELIYNAKVLFVGSYYEAFGRMTAEANFLGTFVIGRNTGGTKEIMELTHGGFLFDNHKEIPSLLKQYLNTNGNIMEEPKQKAAEYFSKKSHCKNIMHIYNEIIKK